MEPSDEHPAATGVNALRRGSGTSPPPRRRPPDPHDGAEMPGLIEKLREDLPIT